MTKSLFIFICLLQQVTGKTQIIQERIPTDNRMRTGIDTIVQNAVIAFINDTSRVGLSVGVYKDGKIYTYNYGSLEKGKQKLPSNKSIYEIGSITKTFTGTLLAQAVLDKKVKIDDDIRKYIDGSYPNLEYQGQPIRLFHLINHMSGLPFFLPNKPEIFQNANYDSLPFTICHIQKQYSRLNFFEDLHKVKLDTVPGFNFHYSNAGAQLLGYILERLYKMPYDKLLEKYISAPLSMKSTSPFYSKNELGNLAKGYNNKGNIMPYNPIQLEAAGGIYSTVADMLKYVRFHLNENNKIVALSHKITWGNIKDFGIGLNWQEKKVSDGNRKIWQSGGTFGFSSYCVIYPELNTGIVILTNEADQTAQGGLEEAANKIFESINKH
ncbi:MAG TPA: serine hydrolase domain-containing protein [Hanamia sp.]